MIAKVKQGVFKVIDPGQTETGLSRVFNFGMLALIFLNVLAVVLETEENIYSQYQPFFYGFEVFSIVIFTLEYILRLWVCTEQRIIEHL